MPDKMVTSKQMVLGGILLFFLGNGHLQAAEPMDLNACFQAALKQSETVAISDAEIGAARGRYAQVLGTLLPHLSVNAGEFLQDTSGNDGSDSVGSTFTRFSRPDVAITLTQNIFQGVKAAGGLKSAKADRARAEFLRRDAERLLFTDVATVFYSIAQVEKEIATTREIVGVLSLRVGEVKKWVDLGKARRSEMAAQEADLALLEAELEAKKGDKTIAYEAMSFLTGLDPQPPIVLKNYSTGKLKSLDDYLEAATGGRSDLEAAKKEADAARGKLTVAKGDLYPQIDVEANYYPYRVGFQKEIKWDAFFTLNLPLFNWETYGAIREAKSEMKQAELTARQTERKTASEVRRAYADYQAAQNELSRYRTAAKKTRQSYNLQIEDWRLGLVDNLDVLQAQRIWLSALRSRDAAEIARHLSWTKLQITAGVTPGELAP